MTLIPTYKFKSNNKFNIVSFGYLNSLWDKTENGISLWMLNWETNIFQINPLYERCKK